MDKIEKYFRASAVIMDGEKILLVGKKRMGSVYWSLPGGGINRGEGVTAACAREAREETGYDVAIEKLLYTRVYTDLLHKRSGMELIFLTRALSGTLDFSGDGDLCEAKWVNLSDIDGYNLKPEILKDVLIQDSANGYAKNPRDLGYEEY